MIGKTGHGGNETSLLDYAEMLGEPFDAQVVCVRAPYDVHRDGYCWFRVNSFVPEPNEIVKRDLPGIIDEVAKLGLRTKKKKVMKEGGEGKKRCTSCSCYRLFPWATISQRFTTQTRQRQS